MGFSRRPSAPATSAADTSPDEPSTQRASSRSASGTASTCHRRSTRSTAIAPQPCCCSTSSAFVTTSARCSDTTALSTAFLSAPTSARSCGPVEGPASPTAEAISRSSEPSAARRSSLTVQSAGTSRGATRACQRPRCFPTHARWRAGSSSFHVQQRDISGVNSSLPSSRRTAQSTSRVPATASQRDGSTTSETGSNAARPTPSTQRAAASILRSGVRVVLRLVDEDAARLRAFIAADDASPLEHVDQPPGAGVAHTEAALDQRDRRGLRLDDDLDRLVEQRVVVRVEVAVHVTVIWLREDLGQLEVALVELLLALPRLLDDERDLLLGDVGALDALQPRGAERLEEHVALTEKRLGAALVEDHTRVRLRRHCERDPGRHVRLDHAGDHVDRRALRGEYEVDTDRT